RSPAMDGRATSAARPDRECPAPPTDAAAERPGADARRAAPAARAAGPTYVATALPRDYATRSKPSPPNRHADSRVGPTAARSLAMPPPADPPERPGNPAGPTASPWRGPRIRTPAPPPRRRSAPAGAPLDEITAS